LDDIDVRLKWSGMFHRRKRAPGTFMMRLKVLTALSAPISYPVVFIVTMNLWTHVEWNGPQWTNQQLQLCKNLLTPFGNGLEEHLEWLMPFGFVVLGLLHAMTVILDLDRLCFGLTSCKCLEEALTGVSGGQVPNGELSSKQLRFLGDQITHLGEKGCADITTRANIQLRGMDLTDSAAIFEVRAISG
jgi:hypothetical protein